MRRRKTDSDSLIICILVWCMERCCVSNQGQMCIKRIRRHTLKSLPMCNKVLSVSLYTIQKGYQALSLSLAVSPKKGHPTQYLSHCINFNRMVVLPIQLDSCQWKELAEMLSPRCDDQIRLTDPTWPHHNRWCLYLTWQTDNPWPLIMNGKCTCFKRSQSLVGYLYVILLFLAVRQYSQLAFVCVHCISFFCCANWFIQEQGFWQRTFTQRYILFYLLFCQS